MVARTRDIRRNIREFANHIIAEDHQKARQEFNHIILQKLRDRLHDERIRVSSEI